MTPDDPSVTPDAGEAAPGRKLLCRGSEHVETRMGDQTVAMSVARGRYFALKGTAQRVWDLLETPRTRTELAKLLAGEYAVSVPDCEADLAPFLSDMIRNGLIVETTP